MYTEIEIISKIPRKAQRVEALMLFIEEYSGWLQHLNTVGLKWGAGGEEMAANLEAIKTRNHIDKLKMKF
jgi:hypothetical protein